MQYLKSHRLNKWKHILVSPHIFTGLDSSNGMEFSSNLVNNVVSGRISHLSELELSL